jgi:hypothetical protein
MIEIDLPAIIRDHCNRSAYRVIGDKPNAPLFVHHETYLDRVVAVLRRHGPVLFRRRTEAFAAVYRLLGPNECYLTFDGATVAGFLTRPMPAGAHPGLRSSEWSISPEDTLFSIKAVRVLASNGCISVQHRDGDITVDMHAWRQFFARSRDDPNHRPERFPELYARRHSLKRLAVLFRGSTPVGRDNSIKQFFRYKMRPASYHTNSGWIFVVVADRRLSTCYFKGRISDYGYTLLTTGNDMA